MHLEPEAASVVGKAEDVVVSRADEQSLDEILVLETLSTQPTPAATLLAIRRDRSAFDVARVGDGDDHVLFGDQIFDGELTLVARDFRAALVTELFRGFLELFAHDRHSARARGENRLQLLHERAHFLKLGLELVYL